MILHCTSAGGTAERISGRPLTLPVPYAHAWTNPANLYITV